MNRLNQRLVAAEQVEGDEGRGPHCRTGCARHLEARTPQRPFTRRQLRYPGRPISRRGPLSLHAAAAFLSCGHRGLETSAIWLIFVAAHAEEVVGLLGGAVLTEHLNAMGAGRS